MMRTRTTVALGIIIGTAAAVGVWSGEHGRLPWQQALFYQSEFVSVPDGTLIRAEGDERVFFAVGGAKRWIVSPDAFRAQGFHDQEVRTLSAAELARYPDGEPITALTRLVLPGESAVLPDLVPLAPYELRLATVDGRRAIRFTGSFWNKGRQAFFLAGRNEAVAVGEAEGFQDVYQRVIAEDGTVREKYVGTFAYHPAHRHQHFSDFGEYLLEPATSSPGTKLLTPTARQKVTFCMRDNERMPADVPDVPLEPVYTVCSSGSQGVSPGWIDVYPWSLADQFVDVHDLPPGVYALSFRVDPKRQYLQADAANDIATTLIELDAARGILRVIASLSPFPSLRNAVADETLLRDASSGNVYVIQGSKKRWLRSVDVFSSYGNRWDQVYPVTSAQLAALLDRQLVRESGTADVWALNANGYRRRIADAAVLASYGWTQADVADVNALDMASYPVSELIMATGDDEVYSIAGGAKRPFGTLGALQAIGHDLRGLSVVSQADLDSYRTVDSF